MADGSMVLHAPTNAEVYRASTDAAGLCREIVLKTAMEIQGRKYVRVEGWQAIAIAHGCTGSAREVEAIEGGVRAIGEIRRMSDGAIIALAEGFVGADEPTWFGGTSTDRWGKTKTLPKRPDYAIRAMAQTRAISRACRSAFAHVVVLIDANLSTTPAEEVPMGGFDDEPRNVTPPKADKPAAKAPESNDDPFGDDTVPGDPEGIACPRPNSIECADWKSWSKVLAATIKATQTLPALDKIERDHANAIMAADPFVGGIRTGMAELFAKQREALKPKRAEDVILDDEIPY